MQRAFNHDKVQNTSLTAKCWTFWYMAHIHTSYIHDPVHNSPVLEVICNYAIRMWIQIKEFLPPPRRLCNARHLSDCWQLYVKATERSSWKFYTGYVHGHRRLSGLNFGSHPLPDRDPGIIWRILQHSEIRHFHNLAHISKKNWLDLYKIWAQM